MSKNEIKTKNKFLIFQILQNYTVIYYILFFLAFALIMALCPYSADDVYYRYLDFDNWYKILHFAAGYGNGRVLGNLLGFILSNSPFLASVVRSLTVTLIVYFISKLFCEEKKDFLRTTLFAGFLFLSVAPLIFGEVYSWISGFSNYTPPILGTLICLYCIKTYDSNNSVNIRNTKHKYNIYNLIKIFIVILAGSATQLFCENATLNSCVLAFSIFIICAIEKNQKRIISFIYLASSGLGAAIMVYARLFIKDKDGIYDTVNYSAKINNLEEIISNLIFNLKKLCHTFQNVKFYW